MASVPDRAGASGSSRTLSAHATSNAATATTAAADRAVARDLRDGDDEHRDAKVDVMEESPVESATVVPVADIRKWFNLITKMLPCDPGFPL